MTNLVLNNQLVLHFNPSHQPLENGGETEEHEQEERASHGIDVVNINNLTIESGLDRRVPETEEDT